MSTRVLLVMASVVALQLAVPSVVRGATRIVPTNYPTIQQAISASSAADTVLVLPGTYAENIWIDRSITVRSQTGPEVTIIDGGTPPNPDHASVVRIDAGRIEGFDIRNGTGWFEPGFGARMGGGLFVTGACVMSGNWIHHNRVRPQPGYGEGAVGAAIAVLLHADSALLSNRIYDNVVEAGNGAVIFAAGFGDMRIEGNEIFDNQTSYSAVLVFRESSVKLNVIACNSTPGEHVIDIGGSFESNTVVGNWSTAMRSIISAASYDDLVCVVRSNCITHNLGPGLQCYQPIGPPIDFIVECNNVALNGPGGQIIGVCEDEMGQNGNISVDPEYGRGACPSRHGDWCLGPASPLLPQNSPPGCGLIGALGLCPPIGVPGLETDWAGRLRAQPARPNPFFERTTIAFYLPEPGEVEISIYGVLGRKVRTLQTGQLGAGDREIAWDGREDDGRPAASGAYVAAIRAGGHEVTRVLLLVR